MVAPNRGAALVIGGGYRPITWEAVGGAERGGRPAGGPSRLALAADALLGRRSAARREARLADLAFVALALLALRVVVEAALVAGSVASDLDLAGFNRDFVQEYLVAPATIDGRDPYVPLVALAREYLPAAVPRSLPNPTPHPPTLIPFVRPLGMLPFAAAGFAWLALQLVAAVALAALLATWARGRATVGRLGWRGVSLMAALVLAWPPVGIDLLQGQLGLVLTALFVAGWYAALRGHERAAGILFGLAVCVKLVPGLLLMHYLVRRRFRVVGWAALTFAAACALTVGDLGLGPFLSYATTAVPQTSEIWLGSYWNNSVFGAIGRALGMSARLLPLHDAPALVFPLALLGAGALCLVAFGCDARAAARPAVADPDEGAGERAGERSGIEFAIWVVAMLLVSPVVWYHYFVALLFPLAVLVRLMARRGWRGVESTWLLVGVGIVAIPSGVAAVIRKWLPGFVPTSDLLSALAFAWSLVPMLGLLLVFGLLAREHLRVAPWSTEASAVPNRARAMVLVEGRVAE